MREPRVRPRGAHEPRREVEVVVVKEDRRVRVVVERGDDRVGERSVDALVAVVPRVVECAAELRPSRRSHSECWMNHSIGFATTL